MQLQNDYFASYRSLKLTRDAHGVLVVEFHTKGGPFRFTGDLRVAQGKPFLISWSAVDADGDALTYMVMASLAGGRSWNLLQLSTRNTSVTVPTKVFARDSKKLLRVVATDGVNTAEALSGPVTIEGGKD